MLDVYVSHAESKKCGFTQLLAQELEASGISYVMNGRGALPAGAAGAAPDALVRSARVGVAIISPAFIQREQPMRELDIFLQVTRLSADKCAVTPSLLPAAKSKTSAARLGMISPVLFEDSALKGQLVTDVSEPPRRAARHAAAGVLRPVCERLRALRPQLGRAGAGRSLRARARQGQASGWELRRHAVGKQITPL